MKKLSGQERGVLALTLVFFLVTVGWFLVKDRGHALIRVEVERPEQLAAAVQPVGEDPAPGLLDGELISINTATAGDLTRLPGIGPVKAEGIVDYRTANGPFLTKEDIMKVSGIGEKTFEKLEAYITVESEGGVGDAENSGGG